jgi:hypothetical protein
LGEEVKETGKQGAVEIGERENSEMERYREKQGVVDLEREVKNKLN